MDERENRDANPCNIHGHRRKRVIVERIDRQRNTADEIHDLITCCITCQLFSRDKIVSEKVEDSADPTEAVNDDFFQNVLLNFAKIESRDYMNNLPEKIKKLNAIK